MEHKILMLKLVGGSMQIDWMDRHFTKSLARALMGSKEKWVSGQGATDKFITDFMPRYISSTALYAHNVTIYSSIYQQLGRAGRVEIYDRGRNRRRSQLRSWQLFGIHWTHKIFTISALIHSPLASQRSVYRHKKNVVLLGMGQISQIQAGIHTEGTPYIKCVLQIFFALPKNTFHHCITSYMRALCTNGRK